MPFLAKLLLIIATLIAVSAGLDALLNEFPWLTKTKKEVLLPLNELNFPTVQPDDLKSSQPQARRQEIQPEVNKQPTAEPKTSTETVILKPGVQTFLLPPPPRPMTDHEFYEKNSKAAVQIFCSGPQEIFAASGAIVSSSGLILTNAHVAEIVKRIGNENCQIRSGSPAEKLGGVEVVFIADTSLKIRDTSVPQRDFAFLKIAEPKAQFTVSEIDPAYRAQKGEWLFTLGYPSEFIQAIVASANSNLVFSKLTVAGTIDVNDDLQTSEGYLFKGGIILQQGSSGTAVFSAFDGTITGLMFATTKGKTTEDREGVALSMPYIDRILKIETGQDLKEFIVNH